MTHLSGTEKHAVHSSPGFVVAFLTFDTLQAPFRELMVLYRPQPHRSSHLTRQLPATYETPIIAYMLHCSTILAGLSWGCLLRGLVLRVSFLFDYTTKRLRFGALTVSTYVNNTNFAIISSESSVSFRQVSLTSKPPSRNEGQCRS